MNTSFLSSEAPAHIIVFRKVTPENVQLLARVLDATPQPAGADVQSVTRTVLSLRNGVHARVYNQLGIAVATLTPEQIYELRQLGDILTITPDEERRLPEVRPVPVTDEESTALQITLHPAELLADPQSDVEPVARAEGTFRQIGLDPADLTLTGRNVRVAVLDTGVDLTHPDLNVQLENTRSFIAEEPEIDDHHGHGTHCAGVIAGSAAPVGGVRYGVAPDVTLFVAKVLNKEGRGRDSGILDAIDWAAAQGAEVISLSLGSPRSKGSSFSARYEALASRLLDRGVLLVAATGNDSARPDHISAVGNPAACPSVLAVTAVDHRDRISTFGGADVDGIGLVDLAAPGVGVLSAWPGGGVQRLSGTSMATPHVAGVAALYLQVEATCTGAALWRRLTDRARPVAGLSQADAGAGIVQAP